MTEARGIVYLIGAGPGDPDLLTRRGEALLRVADVVVYDRLVSPKLLELCRPESERIYVGKEGGGLSVPQNETTRLLIEQGRAGRRVARLKGGDPFVFGRGGEEAQELAAAGVAFEIVPGVSSALAAPAYAGIPVTHRRLASSVTIATGHEDPTKDDSAIDWPSLANGADTLVILMGVEQLGAITHRLRAAGRPADEPAALIRWGTTFQQQTILSTLGEIAEESRRRQIRPPAVLVVGQVVSLAPELGWFERRPLWGRRILVTRAREQASSLVDQLSALGAQTLEFPTIRIEPLDQTEQLDAALRQPGQYEWVVFTSANGVRASFERLEAHGLDARAFRPSKLAAIGPATAEALARRGIRADFVPTSFTSEAIARELIPRISAGARVLLLRADIAPRLLADALEACAARVDNVVAYRTVPNHDDREVVRRSLREDRVDVVTFTSSSTARNLVDALDGEVDLLRRPLLACIGPVTAATARDLGLSVGLVAPVHTVEGLVETLRAHFAPGRNQEVTA